MHPVGPGSVLSINELITGQIRISTDTEDKTLALMQIAAQNHMRYIRSRAAYPALPNT